MLNSFWGKFGQRNNMAKLVYFKDPANYYKLITDPSNIIKGFVVVSDNMIVVNYTKENDFVEVMGNTNVVLAAYTTAQARLRLYSYIEPLGERALYFDTDSVPIGNYMGDMTNELKDYGPDSYITEFVSLGPKN